MKISHFRNWTSIYFLVLAVVLLCNSCQPMAIAQDKNPFSYVQNRPHVRELWQKLRQQSCDIPQSEREKIALKSFEEILRHHPNPAVWDLGNRIREQKLVLIFNTAVNAQFGELPVSQMPSELLPSEKQDHYPILAIDPDIFLCPRDEQRIFVLMIILDHEALHYQQWLSRRPDDREVYKFYERSVGLKSSYSPKACLDIWVMEKEAYLRSCRLINAWQYGQEFEDSLCDYSNDEEFSAKLRRRFRWGLYQELSECQETWDAEMMKQQ